MKTIFTILKKASAMLLFTGLYMGLTLAQSPVPDDIKITNNISTFEFGSTSSTFTLTIEETSNTAFGVSDNGIYFNSVTITPPWLLLCN